jgi:hypothetical protein
MTEELKPPESRIALPKPKRPPGRPPKHGAFSGVELALILPVKRDEIVSVLTGEQVIIGKTDMPAVNLLAGCLAKIELLDRFFMSYGIFDEENKIREGPYKMYLAALNAAVRMLAQLGMTPDARIKLGIGMIQAKKDLATMMSDDTEAPV